MRIMWRVRGARGDRCGAHDESRLTHVPPRPPPTQVRRSSVWSGGSFSSRNAAPSTIAGAVAGTRDAARGGVAPLTAGVTVMVPGLPGLGFEDFAAFVRTVTAEDNLVHVRRESKKRERERERRVFAYTVRAVCVSVCVYESVVCCCTRCHRVF